MVTAEELVVSITSDGTQETQDDLEGVEQSMEDTADSAGDSADELEGFSKKFSGALSAATAALAVGAAGLLSQVPVIGEAMSGLFAIVEALAFQMDSVLRPVLSPIGDFFFDVANRIFEADGAMGTLTGTFGTVAAGAGILIGVLKLIGVALTGPLLAAIGVVAGAIAALWLAWRENFGGIQDVAQDTIDNVSERFSDFVETVKPIVMGFLDTLESAWDSHGETIMDVVNFAFRTIGALIETGIDAILTTIEVGLQILAGDWDGAWESRTDFFSRMVDLWGPLLSEAIDAIIGLMFGLASDLSSWASDLASDAFDWGKGLIESLIDGIRDTAGRLGGVMETVAGAIDEYLPGSDADTGPLATLTLSGSGLIDAVVGGIRDNEGGLTDAVASLGGAVRDSLTDALGSAVAGAETIANSLRDALPEQLSVAVVVSGADELAARVLDGVGDALASLRDAVGGVRSQIVGLLTDTLGAVGAFADQFTTIVRDMTVTVRSMIAELLAEVRRMMDDLEASVPDEISTTLTVESGDVSDAANGRGGSGRPRFGASGGASTGGQQIDGRQISESTGRYRSDPGRRRGI